MENPSFVNLFQSLSLIDPLPDPIPSPPLNFENNAKNLQSDTVNEPMKTEVNNPHAYICPKKNSFGSKFI